MRSLGRAIEYEAARQIELLEAGRDGRARRPATGTRTTGARTPLRTKEEAYDYRYFPEPDLVPLAPDAEWLGRVRSSLPVLPAERRGARWPRPPAPSADASGVVVAVDRGLDELAVAAIAAGGDPARVLVHVEHNLAGDGRRPARSRPGSPRSRGWRSTGKLTATQAKQVLAELVADGGDADPEAIAAAKGFEAMDTARPRRRHRRGHRRATRRSGSATSRARTRWPALFVGAVMKATKGQADGKAVTAALRARRGS